MKKIIKHSIQFLGTVISWICPPMILKALRAFRDSFYTGYIRHRFAHLGDAHFIWKPLNLLGTEYISIGDNTILESALQLTARKTGDTPPSITIGNGCLLRHGCHITATNRITIGDNLLTGTNVIITDNSHGATDKNSLTLPPRQRQIVSKGSVFIGNNVWLGNNVCVLPGVTIGDGVVIGANSVVTRNIPPYSVAVGIPATVIKQG